MSADVAKQSGIETAVAGPGTLRETVLLYGNIQADPQRVRAVTARFPGVVRSVMHQVGDRVQAGQVLATVESNESLQVYGVASPRAGVITQRRTNPGEVAGSEPLFEVADYSSVRAEFNVFPRERARLKLGQAARVGAADSSVAADSRIDYIAPTGNAQSQSVIVRATLNNAANGWAPGQFVTGEVVVAEAKAAVVVVPTALQRSNGKEVLFVQSNQGFDMRPVRIGRRGPGSVEITEGLTVGERYVSVNSYLVKAEVMKNEAAGE